MFGKNNPLFTNMLDTMESNQQALSAYGISYLYYASGYCRYIQVNMEPKDAQIKVVYLTPPIGL